MYLTVNKPNHDSSSSIHYYTGIWNVKNYRTDRQTAVYTTLYGIIYFCGRHF